MSDETFGDHDFSAFENHGDRKNRSNSNADLNAKADALLARRADYVNLAEAFREFWARVNIMGPVERDRWIEVLYAQYLMLAPHLGVSLNGLPQLSECCGQKRKMPTVGEVWMSADDGPPPIWPGDSVYGNMPAVLGAGPPPHEDLGWWPGDIIRRVTRFFGFKYCEVCDQRRRWINEMFGKKY